MQFGYSTRPMVGEEVNGDAYFHKEIGDAYLVSVIDGLGHGPEAHKASQKALEILNENTSLDLGHLFTLLHKGLARTRGGVAAIMVFYPKEHRMMFAGLGNIETDSSNSKIKPFSVSGIIGNRWKEPKIFEFEYEDYDYFVMFSDGISRRFDISGFKNMNCEMIAERIMKENGKGHDDATIVVVRPGGIR